MPTTDAALHLDWVKPAFIYQVCGQTMIHGGVVESLPGFQTEGSTLAQGTGAMFQRLVYADIDRLAIRSAVGCYHTTVRNFHPWTIGI